jgi:hypothetical protein
MEYARLPNETRASHKKAGINRLLDKDMVHKIANSLSKSVGRPMDHIEVRALITHIKKLDGNKFRSMTDEDAVSEVARRYLSFMGQRDFHIYDTHEIMKQYIGGGVKVSPDRFILKKPCGTTGYTPSDQGSVQKVGHRNAYGMFPRVSSYEGMEVRTVEPGQSYTNDDTSQEHKGTPQKTQHQPQTQQLASILDVVKPHKVDPIDKVYEPVVGTWVRKSNFIVPREKSVNILLDSRYKDRTREDNVFKWDVIPTQMEQEGSVSMTASIENITSIQFEEFHIPYIAEADNPYNKISILIQELSGSSVVAHEGRTYHMLFNTTNETNRIRCTPPDQDKGKFHFSHPINLIRTITMSFGAPLTPIPFLPDNYRVNVTSNGVGSTYLTFQVEHQISEPDNIIFTNFTTDDTDADFQSISEMNSVTGLGIAVIDNFTLEVAVDLSTATLNTMETFVVFVTSRRIFIPMRFVYVT